jgi:hypothetical protein
MKLFLANNHLYVKDLTVKTKLHFFIVNNWSVTIDQLSNSESCFPQAYQCYKSVSVPAWNAYALGFQLNTPTSEDSYPFGANKENLSAIKGIVTQVL